MKLILLFITALICRQAAGAGERSGAFKSFKLRSGGYDRTYGVYAPAGLDASKRYPLLVILHGGGGDGKGMRRLTRNRFESLADQNGGIVAYPDGLDKNWNDYRADKSRKAQRENIDDAAFIASMLDEIAKTYPADASRTYAAGISNGAMMSYALACRAAGRFAAVAPVAGAMPENLLPACAPSRPVPLIIINGTKDNLVHWEGGDVTGPFGKRKMGKVISVEKSRDFWLAENGCDRSKAAVSKIDAVPGDGTSVEIEKYAACAGGGAVEFVKIAGGGHTWPGGLQYLPEWLVGKTFAGLSASDEIWSFFMSHPMPPVKSASGPAGPR